MHQCDMLPAVRYHCEAKTLTMHVTVTVETYNHERSN